MKCSNCFNECREGLLFCNICGSMLLTENPKPQSRPAQNTDFTANGRTQPQSTPVNGAAYTVSGQEYKTAQSEVKKEPFANPFDETKEEKLKSPPEPIPQKLEYPETKKQKPQRSERTQKVETVEASQERENEVFPLLNNKESDGVKPVTRGQFTAMELLMYVPVINLILLFIWAFNKNGNPNRRNYAIAKLICIPLLFVFVVIMLVVLYATGIFDSLIASLENYLI
ncbi:MAG: hypothetical protein IJF80_00880 [Clostridia bacterium]|nr:hypothetical protein [Clostridia bacterium]